MISHTSILLLEKFWFQCLPMKYLKLQYFFLYMETLQDYNKCLDGEFELADGTKFAIYGTAYGDGTYRDLVGNEYWVDAGSIGCVLMKDIDLSVEGNQTMGGQIIDFKNDFITSYDSGVIKFGSVHIDTDPVEEEEEYYGNQMLNKSV